MIGNDVWIGENATIMPGVKVDDGAIIAANSIGTFSQLSICAHTQLFLKELSKQDLIEIINL